MPETIEQKQRSEKELLSEGFKPYERKKEVVMARQLSELEGVKTIVTRDGQKLVAEPGYMICYLAGELVKPSLDAYDHWPVEPEIFKQTYRYWDEPDWWPTPAQRHLMSLGCLPYYKAVGVWAKTLDEDVYVKSLEHEEPVKVEAGNVLAIGAEGEPYSMGDVTFNRRYEPPPKNIKTILKKLIGLFK